MKVYLSGPMTGVENYKEIFNQYEKRLTELGFTVFNPAWFDYKEGWSYDEILDLDLAALQKCEAIFMLPGWEKSKGACIEYGYALSKGINIMHVGYLDNAETWEKMHESIFPTCNNVLWKNDEANNKHCFKCTWCEYDPKRSLCFCGADTRKLTLDNGMKAKDCTLYIEKLNISNVMFEFYKRVTKEGKTVSKLEDSLKNLRSDFGSLVTCIGRGMTREEFQQWLDNSETHEFFKKKYRANEEDANDNAQEDEEPLEEEVSIFGMSCGKCVDKHIPPYKGKCFFCARVNRQALNDMYREEEK